MEFKDGTLSLIEHRNVHSLYGFFSNKVTFEALLSRQGGERPFILSRSFYPGAQRYSAIWSGDSGSDWNNFESCVPILLQKSICGITFIGGDVPGFYGNPLLPPDEQDGQRDDGDKFVKRNKRYFQKAL